MKSNETTKSETHFEFVPALDGLRFFAAVFVVLTHLHSHDYFTSLGIEKYHIIFPGTSGVNLFYVLSGFLITTLAITEYIKNGTFNIKNFFARRALRIFPLYYLALFVYLVLMFFGAQMTNMRSFVNAFFYAYNFVPKQHYDAWLGSFHTLATEEHFYLVFPFLFYLGYKYNKYLFIAFILAYIYFVPYSRPYFANFEAKYHVTLWTFFSCVPILVGCCLAFFMNFNIVRETFFKINSSFLFSRITELFLIILFLYMMYDQTLAYNHTKMAIGFSILIIFCYKMRDNYIVKGLSFPSVVYLGKISYGIYIWQSVICGTGDSSRLISNKYLAFAVVIGLAILSYEMYEKKFLTLKQRWK
jgi:peptidoglycan/LPS O-acetylase OafA/YrhL